MARGFVTAENNFIDDFIFQPDWNMAERALLKKNDDIQDKINTLDLIESLNIDHLYFDQDNAKDIKNNITGEVDNVVSLLQKDANSRDSRLALKNLQRSIDERFQTGDIANIQNSAKNYREMEAELAEKVKVGKITQTDAEMYKKGYLNNFLASNPNGSKNTSFRQGDIFDSIDMTQDFAKWWKDVGGEGMEKVFDYKKNGYYWKSTEASQKKLVEDKFKEFVKANPQYANIMRHRQDVGFFNEQYYNPETGELDFDSPNSILSLQNKLAQQLSTTNTITKNEVVRADEFNVLDYKQKLDERAKAKAVGDAAKLAAMFETTTDATKLIRHSQAGRQIESDFIKKLEEGVKARGGQLAGFKSLDNIIEHAKKHGMTRLLGEATKAKELMNENFRAGYSEILAEGVPEETVRKAEKKFQETVKAQESGLKFVLGDFDIDQDVVGSDGKVTSKKTKLTNKANNGEHYRTLQQYKGQVIPLPGGNGEKVKIISAQLKDNSAIPIFARQENDAYGRPSYLANEALAVIEFTYEYDLDDPKQEKLSKLSGEKVGTFELQAGFNMKDGVGFHN